MAKRTHMIAGLTAGLLLSLTAAIAPSPSLAGEISPAPTPAATAEPEAVSSLLGGLVRLSDYLGDIGKQAAAVSKRDINVGKQYRCLAHAVYFEARSESPDGQRAVAHVVLNRLKDRRYPGTVCGVVYQNQHLANRCQFSFACDGLPDRPRDGRAWRRALIVALEALAGVGHDLTQASTHYHARYVDPIWAPSLQETVRVGRHIFYRYGDNDPQTAALGAAPTVR